MHFDFRHEENPDTGYEGLVPVWVRNAEPGSPMTSAHDIMEHFPGEINTDNELLALGAMLFIRGEGGYWHYLPHLRIQCPGHHLSGDLHNMWEERYKWGDLTDPGRTTRLESEQAEFWIEEAIRRTRKSLTWNPNIEAPSREWYRWVQGWLRKGYRKAAKRYQNLSSYELTDIFWQMEKEIERSQKMMDIGFILRVSFVRKTGEFSVRTVAPWEPEHPDHNPYDWGNWE